MCVCERAREPIARPSKNRSPHKWVRLVSQPAQPSGSRRGRGGIKVSGDGERASHSVVNGGSVAHLEIRQMDRTTQAHNAADGEVDASTQRGDDGASDRPEALRVMLPQKQ
eukprot:7256782-Prymnesium_polylepis.2